MSRAHRNAGGGWTAESIADSRSIVEGARRRAACAICRRVGGNLVKCAVCGRLKQPIGRDPGLLRGRDLCSSTDCPGYLQEPHAGELWPGERYGDSLGHMDWHEEAAKP